MYETNRSEGAAVIAAALGACGEGWGNQDPSPQASETGAPDIAYNTGDMVKVRVEEPQQSQSGAKSIAPDAALWFTNTYEVIFRKIGTSLDTDVYYRGVGASAQEYISVEVPIGEKYEVLLIAGIDQTLVGAGYRGKNNDPNGVGYTAALHSPVNIEAGKVNEIAIEVTPLTPQWNTSKNNEITAANKNDFAFYATLENFSTVEPKVRRTS